MILICYDGSADARCAIDSVAELLGGQAATVLTIWGGFATVVARAGAGFGGAALDFEQIDAACKRAAGERAEEGTERARGAGLIAEPRVRERGVTIWATILEEAAALDASAVILGSRGLTGIKSLLLGSVSHGVLQHADRPVIVVPSREAAGLPQQTAPLLVCFDGSEDAVKAIGCAAALLPGRDAIVLSVAVPAKDELPLDPVSDLVGRLSGVYRDWDQMVDELAAEQARRGCELADEAGLKARPMTAAGKVAPTILRLAETSEVALIALGAGRHTAFGGLLGGVSSRVAHGATRPVLVVR